MSKRPSRRIGLVDEAYSTKPSLHEVLDTVMAQTDAIVDGVLEKCTGTLLGMSPSAGKREEMSGPVADALDRCLSDRAGVKTRFAHSLHKGMYFGPGMEKTSEGPVKYEALKLFEDDQLDNTIEQARMAQEIEVSVGDLMPNFDALMCGLMGWVSVQAHINPMRPEIFARALRDALAPCLPDNLERERIYPVAAGHLGVAMSGIYRETSAWLKATGVDAAGIQRAHTGAGRDASLQVSTESSIAKTLLTLDKLRKLLIGNADSETAELASILGGMGGRDFLHTVPASLVALQDMKQVEQLVARLADKAKQKDKSPAEMARQKAMAVELRLGKQVGKHLGNEVVRLMVENLTQDERLLPTVRHVLRDIEPQLVSLGQVDPQFFSEKTHPARRLLERITHRSLGFTATDDAGFAEFFQSVRLVLNSLQRPGSDVNPLRQSFAGAIDLLEATWAQHDAEVRRKQEETARALMHAEQRNLLAQRLAVDMRDRVQGKGAPASINQFLCAVWPQAIAEMQLLGQADISAYQRLADDLIWSVQPELAKKAPQRLVAMIPGMLGLMRSGLKAIAYPDSLINEFFDELIGFHEQSLEGIPRKVLEELDTKPSSFGASITGDDGFWMGTAEAQNVGFVEMDEQSFLPKEATAPDFSGLSQNSSADADEVASPQSHVESIKVPEGTNLFTDSFGHSTDPFDEDKPQEDASGAVPELLIGAWVDLWVQGKWHRANLTWMSPYRTLFMFISKGGLAHSMTRRTLDKLRSAGQLRVVAQGDVVDQAFDGVARTALRNSALQAEGKDAEADQAQNP
jgi:hypothetical protein